VTTEKRVSLSLHVAVSQDAAQRAMDHDETLYVTDDGNDSYMEFSCDLPVGDRLREVRIAPIRTGSFFFIKTTVDIDIRFDDETADPIHLTAPADAEARSTSSPVTPRRMGVLLVNGATFTRIYVTNVGTEAGELVVCAAGAKGSVLPLIVLQPDIIVLAGPAIGPDPTPVSAAILNGGDGNFAWIVSAKAAWLTVTPSSGNSGDAVAFSCVTTGQPVGATLGSATITGAGASNSPQNFTVWRIVT